MGFIGSDGIYRHEEGDTASPGNGFSTLLNLVAQSIAPAIQGLVEDALAADPTIREAMEQLAQETVDDALDTSPRIPELGNEDTFEIVDEVNALAFRIDKKGRAMIADGIDSGRESLEITDELGALAFAVRTDGSTYIAEGAGGGSASEGVSRVRVLISAGQSLPSGRGKPLLPFLDVAPANLWQVGHKTRTLRPATSPLDMMDAPSGISYLWVAGVETARTAVPGEAVVVIPAAYGGTGLYSSASPNGCWRVDYTGANRHLFALMMEQIRDARTLIQDKWPGAAIDWEWFHWGQGEYDAQQGVSQANYAGALDALIDGVRDEIGDDVPVIITQSIREWMDTEPGSAAIQRAQIDTLARRDRTAFVYMPFNASNHGDLIHPNRGAYEVMGRRILDAVPRAHANIAGTSPVPPLGVCAHLAGGVLDVHWERPACHATGYRVEYSVDGGAWTLIDTSASPLDREARRTGVAAGVVRVRVSTLDGAVSSDPSTPITLGQEA